MIRRIHQNITCVSLPSRTLPPANHTHTYIIGSGRDAVLIDLGSQDEKYLKELSQYLTTEGIVPHALLLTHHHQDHTRGARWAKEILGVHVFIHSQEANVLKNHIHQEVDGHLHDGMRIATSAGQVQVIHTPGHSRGSVCFYMSDEGILFSGDLIAGEGYIVISPEEGDMDDYLHSLEKLKELPLSLIAPSHGVMIEHPYEKIEDYIQHRLKREELILNAVLSGRVHIREITVLAYEDVPKSLHGLAMRSAQSHLIRLQKKGMIQVISGIGNSQKVESYYYPVNKQIQPEPMKEYGFNKSLS